MVLPELLLQVTFGGHIIVEATYLLHANHDARTIQELLGHSSMGTTMIYTHTVKCMTIKEAKGPLDF
jgi:integrase